MKRESPYPDAVIARVPRAGALISGVLIPRSMGYLAIRISFHKTSLAEHKVQFFLLDGAGRPGASEGDILVTDASGVARLSYMVSTGRYLCQIQHQPVVMVPTVLSYDAPFPIVLPVGRPYLDVDEDHEFDRMKVADE